jgi:hypothetical protein
MGMNQKIDLLDKLFALFGLKITDGVHEHHRRSQLTPEEKKAEERLWKKKEKLEHAIGFGLLGLVLMILLVLGILFFYFKKRLGFM